MWTINKTTPEEGTVSYRVRILDNLSFGGFEDTLTALEDPRLKDVHMSHNSMRISERVLSAEPLEALMTAGSAYSIPPIGFSVAPGERELDLIEARERIEKKRSHAEPPLAGFRYGIEFETGNAFVRLSWWHDTPDEWADFRAWVLRLQEFLEQQTPA